MKANRAAGARNDPLDIIEYKEWLKKIVMQTVEAALQPVDDRFRELEKRIEKLEQERD